MALPIILRTTTNTVACEKCSKKFHVEERCLGINHTNIEALLIDNNAISYTCCVCHRSSNNFNGFMGEAMDIIDSSVSDMRKVMAEMSMLTGNAHRLNNSIGASQVLSEKKLHYIFFH